MHSSHSLEGLCLQMWELVLSHALFLYYSDKVNVFFGRQLSELGDEFIKY